MGKERKKLFIIFENKNFFLNKYMFFLGKESRIFETEFEKGKLNEKSLINFRGEKQWWTKSWGEGQKMKNQIIGIYKERWTDEIHPNENLFGKIADILAVEIATKSKGRK